MKADIIFTAVPEQMQGKYVAENLYRKWKKIEEVTDEKTGKKKNKEVEHKELIIKRGELLDADAISKVMFHIQTREINGVYCSDIQRRAILSTPPAWQKPWKITVENSIKPKKHTILLYAKTVADALTIATEFMERTYDGIFSFKSVGNFDDAVFVAPEPRPLKEGEKAPKMNFYQISVTARWRDDNFDQDGTVVLQAENVDEALSMIEKIIMARRQDFVKQLKNGSEDKERIKKEEKRLKEGFDLTLNEAKIVNCTDIVPKELSNAFYPNDRK